MRPTLRQLPFWSLVLTAACAAPEQAPERPGSDAERKRAAQEQAEVGRKHTQSTLERGIDPAAPRDKPAKPAVGEPPASDTGRTPQDGRNAQGSAGTIERRMLDGELHEVAHGSADAKTADDARNGAVAAARASLVAYQKQRIKQDLTVAVSEKISGEGGQNSSRYREEMQSLLVARSDGELQRCRVLDAPPAQRVDTGYRATATVAIPERLLFPQRRLQALVEDGKAPVDSFVQLAHVYEGEGQLSLAEQALRWAYDRGGGAAAALELAKHCGRRALEADALRWCEVALREAPADSPLAAEAKARAETVRGAVEPADRLAEQLVQVAESKRDPTRFSAHVLDRRVAGGEVAWDLRWSIRGNQEARVLKTWFDDSLTPAWWASDEGDEPQPSARDGGVQFNLPRDAKPARVIFWLLPLDSELWPRLIEWKNVEVKLGEGASDEQQRLRLRDLLVGLRNSRAVAAIVPVSAQ